MTTPILNLDEMNAAQAQPHIVVNEHVRALEVFGQLIVVDVYQNTPPGSASEGDAYILGSNPTGTWSAFADFSVVFYAGGDWIELPPKTGWRAYNRADYSDYQFDESDSPPWTAFVPGGAPDASAVTYTQTGSPPFSPAAATVADALDDTAEYLDALDEWVQELRSIGIPYAQPGLPGASAVYNVMIPHRLEIPAALVGTRAYRGTAPTATATFDLAKNGTSFGTIVFGVGNSIVLTAATRTEFIDGDRLTITAPAGPDATLADVGFTIKAFRVLD